MSTDSYSYRIINGGPNVISFQAADRQFIIPPDLAVVQTSRAGRDILATWDEIDEVAKALVRSAFYDDRLHTNVVTDADDHSVYVQGPTLNVQIEFLDPNSADCGVAIDPTLTR